MIRRLAGRSLLAALLATVTLAGCLPAGERATAAGRVERRFNLSYSGIAPLDGDAFLVVHDSKGAAAQPRIGVLTLPQQGAARYQSLSIADWKLGGRVPDDLESVCALPGRAGEFLLAESGQWLTHRGMMLHLGVAGSATAGWTVRVLHVVPLPVSAQGGTPDASNYEGLVCAAAVNHSVTLLLGERGASKTFPRASLWPGSYLPASGVLQMAPEAARISLPLPQLQIWEGSRVRGIADLAIAADGVIWAVATQDPGDHGPFRSVVYRAGVLHDGAVPAVTAAPAVPTFFLDGIKVEGLTVRPDHSFVFASDDESFGGAFGTLPAPDAAR